MKKILFFSLALLATAHTFSMECPLSIEQQNSYKNLYTCQICPKQPSFGNQDAFEAHVQKSNYHYRMATKYMTTSCRECGLRFASATEKLSHSAEVHPSNTRKRKRTARFDMHNAMELLNNGEGDTVTLYLTEEEIQQRQTQIQKQKMKKRNTKRRKKANILSEQPVQEISVTTDSFSDEDLESAITDYSSDKETESNEDFEMNGIALLLQLKRITRF